MGSLVVVMQKAGMLIVCVFCNRKQMAQALFGQIYRAWEVYASIMNRTGYNLRYRLKLPQFLSFDIHVAQQFQSLLSRVVNVGSTKRHIVHGNTLGLALSQTSLIQIKTVATCTT